MSIRQRSLLAAVGVAVDLAVAAAAHAQLFSVSTFNPSGAVYLCGLGFDPTTGNVWVYPCASATVQEYSPTGAFLFEFARPGEITNDVDIEFAPEPLTLGSTPIAEGTLLFINGESGTAEIYAVDKSSGAILGTLNTSFGDSHVVGGGYHPDRDTFFLVQDRIPGAAGNLVGEVDPVTGEVLNTFGTLDDGVDINYGDLDVSAVTGNLLVVSSYERMIAEFTPDGTLVQELGLPDIVRGLSGVGIDDHAERLWVGETWGNVWLFCPYPSPAYPGDFDDPGDVDVTDLMRLLGGWGPCRDCSADLDGSGQVDVTDLTMLLGQWGSRVNAASWRAGCR